MKNIHVFIVLSIVSFFTISGQNKTEKISLGIKETFHSKILGEQREIFICLPESYSENNHSYPVLYLLDADFSPVLYEAAGAVRYLHYFEEYPDFIIVGVSTRINRDGYFVPEDDIEDNQTEVKKFQRFLTEEIFNQIQKNYRTTDFRVLYGGSNAGLFSIYNLMTNPESFDAIIASSPTIGHCPELINSLTDSFIKSKSSEHKIVYLNLGGTDTHRTTDYLPQFYNGIKNKMPAGFHIKYVEKIEQGHVPFGSIFDGLKYILINSDD